MGNFKKRNISKTKSIFLRVFVFIFIFYIYLYISQTFFAHRYGDFTPDYQKINIEEILQKETLTSEDYQTLFLQSGLGKIAIDYLIENDDSYEETILQYQNYFFEPKHIKCEPLLGIFTREDILVDVNMEEKIIPFIGIRPGDILVTTSTHSAGWRHGHSGIVLGKGRTLECTVLGSNSEISKLRDWERYANVAVLRVKNSTKDNGLNVAEYAYNNLVDVPYRLTSGLWGQKATASTSPLFGLNCGYLVWYAWQEKGIDLDSDGGKIVTPTDILKSNHLEVIQLLGMDPREYLE